MNELEVLLKSLLLLAAEYKLKGGIESKELVEEILIESENRNHVKVFKDNTDLVEKIRKILYEIIEGKIQPKEDNLVDVEILLAEQPYYIKLFEKYINKDITENMISNLKRSLLSELKSVKAKKIGLEFLGKLNRIKNVDELLESTINKLQKIKDEKEVKIAGLVAEVDLTSEASVKDIAKRAKDLAVGEGGFKIGWPCINDMIQGGFRRGEFITVSALQHNYKSGFVKSIFAQMLRLNKPKLEDPSKKPMILFISLEEELENIFLFLYQYLKFSIENVALTKSELKELDQEEMSKYVAKQLTVQGFHPKLMRFNPSYLTYEKLFKIVEDFEASGYEVQAVIVDYVKKMNRAGCNSSGPQGTDLLDLFSRIRNFMSSKKITFITPHQLSSEAKRLIRNRMPVDEFVKFVAHKGYYADSAQLDQEIDLEIFLGKAKINREWYLAVQLGKHRIATTLPEEKKFTMLKFPKQMVPIPEQNEHHDLVCTMANTEQDEFDF